jgi:alkylated DNA repair protein (DNA oxidative demethylase)
MLDLWSAWTPAVPLAAGVHWFKRRYETHAWLPLIERLSAISPFRHLKTRQGVMSVALTNAGQWGWHSDERGYRYESRDPLTSNPWPAIPDVFRAVANECAAEAGFADFEPDCLLINRYEIGAKMGAHRDYDERDYRWPIVSVSIGLPADFVWYGERKSNPPQVIRVEDGDVVVFGGPARRGYHAVRTVKPPPLPGPMTCRYNLTFRRAR